MTKLLQRLPDRSREEVRNQAIVLVQQLTSRNEEMKKTVVFNEVCTTFMILCDNACCDLYDFILFIMINFDLI